MNILKCNDKNIYKSNRCTSYIKIFIILEKPYKRNYLLTLPLLTVIAVRYCYAYGLSGYIHYLKALLYTYVVLFGTQCIT